MDDVLEENLPNHALEEQRYMAKRFRNLGIGIMSLHNAFIKMGIVYGSKESIQLSRKLMQFIFRTAVLASAELAEERGNFEGYTPLVWDSSIIHHAFSKEEIEQLKTKNKLRNCSLISVAPTGSLATMLNVSSGVEPWFSMHYTRNTKSLEGKDTSFEVWAPIAEEANKRNWHPETLVTSNNINYIDHINIQAAVQEYCDTAIKKLVA